ncbi:MULTISPECIES: hypothetical protein [Rhizobium]|uniref:hypothetical protein n=1 Tax=Rhizobium TaxID=379 RepID=UPI0019347142|nr:hypothetical protein [Rhizobium rosettiformans]
MARAPIFRKVFFGTGRLCCCLKLVLKEENMACGLAMYKRVTVSETVRGKFEHHARHQPIANDGRIDALLTRLAEAERDQPLSPDLQRAVIERAST